MKKKIILINISKSSAEVDWLLPVLYQLKNRYKIITLFQNNNAYETLKRDETIFQLWKVISSDFSIDNIFDKFSRFISKKIFNKFNVINYFLKKNINFSKIKFLFSEFGTYSWLIDEVAKQKNRPITIHFPTSSYIFGIEKKNPIIKYSLKGDFLFLCNKLDINHWEKRIAKRKIKIVGVPKYDKDWLKKLIKKKILIKKPIILVAYSSRFNLEKKNNKNLEIQLSQIMNVLKKFNDHKIIFKIHPRKNDPYYLKILRRFKDVDWEISNRNLLTLTKACNVFVHDKYSSVIYEGLVFKKPCIEYWDLKKDTNTIYAQDYLKLNVVAKNPIKLHYYINLAINHPRNKIWIKQYNNFKLSNEKFNIQSSKQTANLMTKIDNNMNK